MIMQSSYIYIYILYRDIWGYIYIENNVDDTNYSNIKL